MSGKGMSKGNVRHSLPQHVPCKLLKRLLLKTSVIFEFRFKIEHCRALISGITEWNHHA